MGSYAVALHGGAGFIEKTLDPERKKSLEDGLSDALKIGRDMLAAGARSIDVVEAVVRSLEDNPNFNAGKGAVFTHDGTIELEASIMDGQSLAIGAVCGLTTVKNPISLARKVMDKTVFTETTFLYGDFAEKFADTVGVERVPPEYFFTQRRYDDLLRQLGTAPSGAGVPEQDQARTLPSASSSSHSGDGAISPGDAIVKSVADLEHVSARLLLKDRLGTFKKTAPLTPHPSFDWDLGVGIPPPSFSGDSSGAGRSRSTTPLPSTVPDGPGTAAAAAPPPRSMETVGCVAVDVHGNVAAATSTGGRTNKMAGRVGDTPIIGAGNYASNKSCAVSGTGSGEEFQRHCTAYAVSAAMEFGGMSVTEASRVVMFDKMKAGDGGVIAVDARGNIAMVFNSLAMLRGAADSNGRWEVGIWE